MPLDDPPPGEEERRLPLRLDLDLCLDLERFRGDFDLHRLLDCEVSVESDCSFKRSLLRLRLRLPERELEVSVVRVLRAGLLTRLLLLLEGLFSLL